MRYYDHVLSFAIEHPWSLTRPMLCVVAQVLARRLAGEELPRAELEAALVNRKNLPQPRAGTISVIPIYGVLAPRMNLFSEISGGTSYQKIASQLHEAMGDKTVKTIVLDIDSPGGSVAGNPELARELMQARTKKPIVAVGQYTMASAAYHIAAAATEISAAPSAQVGSIGTYGIHDDLSEALKQIGIKRTFISAGEGKTWGNSAEPLGVEAQARLQAAVDDAYGMFVTNVVRGRGQGMTEERVRDEWKAHVYSAAEAKRLGLIDRVETLDQAITRLLTDSSDEADQRAAETFTSIYDTPQEPAAIAAVATGQDRGSDIAWQNEIERQLQEL